MHLLHFAAFLTVASLGNSNVLVRRTRHSDDSDWSYVGDNGPEHWPGVCQTGERQSPVDLVGPFERLNGEPLSFDGAYKKNTAWIASWDGHAYVATMATPTETAILDGGSLRDAYIFKSLHVHWGAEHTISGSRGAAEMHLVHYNAKYSPNEASTAPDGLAVVGIILEESENAQASAMSEFLEAITDESRAPDDPIPQKVMLRKILPDDQEPWIRYNGSLTTPGCTENVQWTVLMHPVLIPPGLARRVRNIHMDSYRPTQPLRNRTLYAQGLSYSSPSDSKGAGHVTSSWPIVVLLFGFYSSIYFQISHT